MGYNGLRPLWSVQPQLHLDMQGRRNVLRQEKRLWQRLRLQRQHRSGGRRDEGQLPRRRDLVGRVGVQLYVLARLGAQEERGT